MKDKCLGSVYKITNTKTGLSKLIFGDEFNKKQMKRIIDFYRNHKTYIIER